MASKTRRCSNDGCDRPHEARGLCKTHYNQWWEHRESVPEPPLSGRGEVQPTPHDQCRFTIQRAEIERWREDISQRFARWDAVRTDLWHRAHADNVQMAAD